MENKINQLLGPKRVFFSLLFSVAVAWGFKDTITLFLLGGKSFSGRSFIGQVGIVGLIIIFSFIFWGSVVNIFGWLFSRYSMWFNQKLELIGLWVNRIVLKRSIVWVFPILAGIILLITQIRLISFPYELEYREGAVLLTTEGLLHGINPYTLENNPIYINVYGAVYNLFVLPFAFLFGNSLALHRIVSALFTFCQVGLIIAILRQRKTSWLFAVIAGLFIWLGQMASTSPLARPDTLGEFLFLCSLFIPYYFGFKPLSVIFGVVFGIIGFYTKPYFILGIPILLGYIFLFISKKEAILGGIGSLIGLVATALIVNRFFEAYFLNTIYSHIADAGDSLPYLIGQIITFAQNYWSILLVSGLGLLGLVVKAEIRTISRLLKIDISHLARPLLALEFNFFIFCLIPPAILIISSMGKHTGATQIYFYQLLTPFVMIPFISWVNSMNWQKGFVLVLVMINLITHSLQTLAPDLDFSVTPGWNRLTQILSNRSHVLNSPVSVSILTSINQPVMDSGQTWYYRKISMTPSWFYPDLDHWKQIDRDFLNSIQTDISQKRYDLIMLDPMNKYQIDTNLVQTYYQQDGEITVEMPHTSQIWRIELWVPK
jgi:hypothetical protein